MRLGQRAAAIVAVFVLGTFGIAGGASASTTATGSGSAPTAAASGTSAPTPTVPPAGTTRSTSLPSSPRVAPEDAGACTAILQAHNPPYIITPARYAACQGAGAHSSTIPSIIAAIAICSGLLITTAVSVPTAGAACTAGAVPGATTAQFCYQNGSYACLNAWSGGPFVKTYTGGPETSDTNQDFTLIHNPATDYAEIAFTGGGSWSGYCVGDSNNNPNLADAGLVSCGTSGDAGWGTNLAVGTNGCPANEVAFFDSHWSGYLGPPNGYVDGSDFFLNKPYATPTCFSVTFES